MNVEGPDRVAEGGTRSRHHVRSTVAGPGPSVHVLVVAVPPTWPEAVAYLTGQRLMVEGVDHVWALVRAGVSITELMTPEEVEAHLVLPDHTWERWFRLGWIQAGGREEEE